MKPRIPYLVCVCCLLLLVATAPAMAADWTRVHSPQGYALEHPADWRLQSGASGLDGAIVLSGPEGQNAVIWPVYVARALDPQQAGLLLADLAPRVLPGHWQTPRQTAPGALVQTGSASGSQARAVLEYTANPQAGGTLAVLYLAAAPQGSYDGQRATFARIFSSYAPLQDQTAPAAAGEALSYVRWTDPMEAAFSMEVPRGWPVQGGLVRKSTVDIRSHVRLQSPDGQIRIFVGDAELPTFVLPTQTLAWTGFTEGTWYSPDSLNQMMVAQYVPGAAFAREYAASGASGCPNLTITSSADHPEWAAQLNQLSASYGLSAVYHAGEAGFTCSGDLVGNVTAWTLLIQNYGMEGGIWKAEYLYGFIAPQARAPQAAQVLGHMLASLQVNPRWAGAQQQMTAQTAEINRQTNEYISKTINDSYWARQQVQDQAAENFSKALRGVEDVHDPTQGETWEVESGSNHYWINHAGTIVGTETWPNPDPTQFREMLRLDQ